MTKAHKRSARALFIGNSFTARNDLPAMIAELAAVRGVHIEHELLSIGGASLRTHWNKGEAPARIKDGKFDYVVLQEQSTLPVKNARRMRENILLFDQVIRSVGSKTVLYMTWARKHEPEKQEAISEAYEAVGHEIRGIVVPVGRIWHRLMSESDAPSLYDKDQSHPTIAGSYLAACVFLAGLFDVSPIGIETKRAAITATDAQLIQNASKDVTIPHSGQRSGVARRS